MGEAFQSVKRTIFGTKAEIFQVLTKDHQTLRALVQEVESLDDDIEKKRERFGVLAQLIMEMSYKEDQVYERFLQTDEDCESEILECIEEHQIHRDMLRRLEATSLPERWNARAKVFLEYLEQHLEEEEQELYPLVRPHVSTPDREALAELYASAIANAESDLDSGAPHLLPSAAEGSDVHV